MADLLPSTAVAPLLPASYQGLDETTASYAHAGLHGAANTQRAYQSDLKQVITWLGTKHPGTPLLPMTPAVLADYAASLAESGKKLSTIHRRVAAINKAHELAGLLPPKDAMLAVVLKGINRKVGKTQRQAKAFTVARLKKTVASIDTSTLQGLRDRALLLIGFSGAFRRSELVALDLEHFELRDGALVVTLPRSKTNQEGNREEKALFYSPSPLTCPIRAFEAWRDKLNRTTGPVFVRLVGASKHSQPKLSERRLAGAAVNKLVQRYLDDTVNSRKPGDRSNRITAHSLRASFVTEAVRTGQNTKSIMNQTKHKSTAMVERYQRNNDVIADNAAQNIGL
ncbi:tyrosine-type recombinase/integrase [Hymenobacter jeollabukensis]|uniref:Integrase n=1 Tax=Hymenobacter jeollabukensis TaxID=2025313 RepID=A0A5R8WJA7_9BACT|nr:tyrosine-type recombinase/integrase [Hymenobacter jeollabukensis]TLM88751.1 hypothetical protein FDY95_23240 [Hymenobacter jeollabukensis]